MTIDRSQPIQSLSMDLLDFELPKELIATAPANPRDASKLLVVQRSDPSRMEHLRFADLPSLLKADDVLVMNQSKVVPARLVAINPDTGGRLEGLYLRDTEFGDDQCEEPGPYWIAMIRAKRTKPGKTYQLINPANDTTPYMLTLVEKHAEDGPGAWVVRVSFELDSLQNQCTSEQVLEGAGHTPLPPYIVSQRKERGEDHSDGDDRIQYQTLYAHESISGSVAAPTAGLHFTEQVFDLLKQRGVHQAHVTLHVGAGTFKPVETERLEDHPMHYEQCSLGDAGRFFESEVDQSQQRIIAVGSTSARTLESFAQIQRSTGCKINELPEKHSTDLLISPGYEWLWVHGMVTNFHLPRSTLLAMVASLLIAPDVDGVERVQEIYAKAIEMSYRFYSYGDAMLILP